MTILTFSAVFWKRLASATILTFPAVHSDIFRGSRLVILTNIAVYSDIFRGPKVTFFAVHGPHSDKYRGRGRWLF
jgi:hypothetical protein